MRNQGILVAVLLLSTSSAHALNQSKHYDITLASCTHAGLPSSFCQRVGVEDYDVDASEFNDLSAHSQIPAGSNACDAANASLWRVFWFGGEVRATAIAVGQRASTANANLLAQHLGRALHTIQDNCAHSGMGNPQHAWHSLSDTCRKTTESPDVQPAAFSCAANETDAVFSAFVDVLHDTGATFSSLRNVGTDDDKHWPAYTDVCDFLGSAGDWSGVDQRWELSVMRPALTDRFVRSLYGASDSEFARVCTGARDGVARLYSDARLDTSGGAQSCLVVHAFCLGKADGAAPDSEPPPYEDDPTAGPTPAAAVTGGCSAAGPSAPATAAVPLGLLLAALSLRRRRRAV